MSDRISKCASPGNGADERTYSSPCVCSFVNRLCSPRTSAIISCTRTTHRYKRIQPPSPLPPPTIGTHPQDQFGWDKLSPPPACVTYISIRTRTQDRF